MIRKKFILAGLLFLLSLGESIAQTDSTFWFAVPYATPHHVTETGGVIRLTTRDRDARVTITRPASGDVVFEGLVPAGQTESVVLPPSYVQNELTSPFWDIRENSSFLIQSRSPSGDMPPQIKAYYEIARVDPTDTTVMVSGNNNPDIFSLKGKNALGREFYVPFQTRWNNEDWNVSNGAFSSIVMVATENNTTITFNSPYPVAQSTGGNYTANTDHSITLDRGETYKITPRRKPSNPGVISVDADYRLRGAHVTSDKPIAVTTGDDSNRKEGAYDFIGDQLVPISNIEGEQVIGHEYLVMRGRVDDDHGGERLYVLATENNTTVELDGSVAFGGPIDAGDQEVYEIPPGEAYTHVNADKPVYVFHVSGFGDELGGAVLPTIDGCTGSMDVSFVRSKRGSNGDRFYLNLMTKKEGIDNFHVVTDNGNTTYDLNPGNFTPVPGTDWYVLDQGDDNLFTDAEITPQTVTRVYNDSAVFHLGMINGRQTGGGCMYGYFSDYIDAVADVVIVSTGSQFISGCFGDTIQLRASGGISYQWQPASGYLDDPTIAEPKAIGLPPGLYKYDAIIDNPCFGTDTLTVFIEIYENVEAFFEISSGIGCAPFDVEINNKTTGANVYKWDWQNDRNFDYTSNSDTNIVHTFDNTTSSDSVYTMRLVAQNDSTICSDEYERQVRVHPEIRAGFDQDRDLGCHPLEVLFSDTSSGHTDPGGYEWDLGDGASSASDTTVRHTYINNRGTDTTYQVELVTTSPALCRDTARKDITVRSYLEAGFTMDTVQGCSPFELDIEHTSRGDVDTAFWHFTGTSGLDHRDTTYGANVAPPPTLLYDTATNQVDTIDIVLRVSNGYCYDTARRRAYVFPPVTAGYTPGAISGCNPLAVSFNNHSSYTGMSPGDTTGLLYDWSFGDGASSERYAPDHLYNHLNDTPTTYRVELMVSSPHGCRDTAASRVNVAPYIRADFKVEENQGCSPFQVQLHNTSEGGVDSIYWDFQSDGLIDSTLHDTAFTRVFYNRGTSPDTVDIRQVVANPQGCRDTMERRIYVYPDVQADFVPLDTAACHPAAVTFANHSSYRGTPDTTGLTYHWEFGDGATSSLPNPGHTFYNYDPRQDTSYTVNLEVVSPHNCRHDTSRQVAVYHQPRARFDLDTTASCPPLEVSMENTSTGHSAFEWRFGDGNTNSTDPVVADYSYGGNTTGSVKHYQLELYVESNRGCADSSRQDVSVYPEVMADFAMDDPAGCHPHAVSFTGQSQHAGQYSWDFGDGGGSTQEDPVHRFVNPGSSDTAYSVELIAGSVYNCRDTAVRSVEVYARPNARFNATPELQQWPGNRVSVSNLSNAGAWKYQWDFGDGSSLTTLQADEPDHHDYEKWGHYTIELSVHSTTSPCMDTTAKEVQVLPPETFARFTMDDADGCEPHNVSFSGGASPFAGQTGETYQYHWEFGDGSTAEGRYPTHVYDSAGTYYVSMEAIGAGGSDMATDTVVVYKVPEVDFEVEPKVVMLPDQVMHCYNFTDYAENYKWNFGDGATSEKKNPQHAYEKRGTYDVVLTGSTRYNDHVCADSLRKVDVVSVQGKGFIEFPDAFTPSPSGPSEGYWDPQDMSNDIFHPVGEGIDEYKLEIFNKWGERLFISEDFRIGWDGYYNGELMPQDVYIYKAEGRFSNGAAFEKMGNVTLLR